MIVRIKATDLDYSCAAKLLSGYRKSKEITIGHTAISIMLTYSIWALRTSGTSATSLLYDNSEAHMNAISEALAQVLLNRHRDVCASLPTSSTISDLTVRACTISCGALCERAGVPIAPVGIGPYLKEVAHWCTSHPGWQPIHALAVNGDSHIPGESYWGSAGSTDNWESDVRRCIAFRQYSPGIA
jgi:hypothetical protein